MRVLIFCSLILICLGHLQAEQPNVLLIVSDDLAATLGSYGFPQAKTPNLDRLAKQGVLFERAYCQFPHCNPSRSSFLSGLRPNVTRVTNNSDNLYEKHPGIVTLPHHFRKNGYATARCGKLFHLGVPSGLESMDDPQAWDFGMPFRDERPYPPARESAVKVATGQRQGLKWREIPDQEDQLIDTQHAKTAIRWLEERDSSRPFFLAVGFHRPHTPLVAPARYFDLYPIEEITLPNAPDDDETDIPLPARNEAVPQYTLFCTPEQRKAAIRAYLACVSYIDDLTGSLLDTLVKQGLAGNTIVIFTSDHGWHLGEHGLWHKRSVFEECARVPLIIAAPGFQAKGERSRSLVELLDLYPTLCDLCSVPIPETVQGKSLRPLLNDANAPFHDAAFTEARRGPSAEYWGRSVRTPEWRYTEWNEGRDGVELYNHTHDPHEYTNLAQSPEHAKTIQKLKALLKDDRIRSLGPVDADQIRAK